MAVVAGLVEAGESLGGQVRQLFTGDPVEDQDPAVVGGGDARIGAGSLVGLAVGRVDDGRGAGYRLRRGTLPAPGEQGEGGDGGERRRATVPPAWIYALWSCRHITR